MQHKTVLLHEAVDSLQLTSKDTVFDATFGSGGHAAEILKKLGKRGTYIGVDVDQTAFDNTRLERTEAEVHLVNDNFKNITHILSSLHISSVDSILADLGWRMEQFSESNKGFSFNGEEPLHMTLGAPEDYLFTAADIVNEWEESSIADVIYGYGEERASRRIAKAIVEARKITPFTTTKQLTDCIVSALPKSARYKKIHPATKTYQGLRIAVNDELGILESFLKDAFMALKPGGRLSIISFHSLEDRIVKHYFRELVEGDMGTLLTKKPVAPSDEELAANPRARSAKLRTIIKT